MPLEKHKWTCLSCGETIENYSKNGLNTLIRLHETEHALERMKRIKEFDEIAKSAPPKDYNKLKISVVDIGFLKSRGIKVDDDMELVEDGRHSGKYREPKM